MSTVYAIKNTLDGKCYVGATTNAATREMGHRSALRHGKHHSARMQEAWDRDGEAAFRFIPLRECSRAESPALEERYMRLFRSWDAEFGYNMHIMQDGVNVKQEVSKAKMRGAGNGMFGRTHTAEARAAIAAATKKQLAEKGHPGAVLTWEIVREIRAIAKANGYVQGKWARTPWKSELVSRFGISADHLSLILTNYTWKELG